MNTQPQHIQGNATGATKPFEVKMECGDTLGLTIRGQIMKGSVYGAKYAMPSFSIRKISLGIDALVKESSCEAWKV
jgi:hypothetical protein